MDNRALARFWMVAGAGIIVFAAALLLIICGLLVLGLPVSGYPIILALGITVAFLWWASRYYFPVRYRWVFSGVVLCVGLATALAAFSNYLVYDISWDGQTYHSEAVIELTQGWNPYPRTLPTGVFYATYLDYYAKGPWLASASLYKLTGAFNLAKLMNSLHLFASFCLAWAAMLSFRRLNRVWGILLSLLLAFNPISVSQLFTLYVDGQFSSLLVDLVCVLILLNRRIDPVKLAALAGLLIVILNVKLTAVLYVGVIVGGFVLWYVVRQKQAWRQLLATTIGACLLGGVFVGYNPNITQYLTQLLKTGSPFYPLNWGELTAIERNSPRDFVGKSSLEKLTRSVFSYADNPILTTSKLKTPFSVSKSEILIFHFPDVRVSGWGPLFGMSLLAAMATAAGLLYARRHRRLTAYFLFWPALLLVSVLSNPESWWARYSPQFWTVPVLIAVWGLVGARRKVVRWLTYGLLAILCLNSGLVASGYFYSLLNATRTRSDELAALSKATQSQPIIITFTTADDPVIPTFFIGTRTILDEAHVSYLEVEENKFACPRRVRQLSFTNVRYCPVE